MFSIASCWRLTALNKTHGKEPRASACAGPRGLKSAALRVLSAALITLVGLAGALLAGCNRPAGQRDQQEVVVYTALDRQFSEPILRAFTEKTGIEVLPVYDTESTKTVGLVNRIRAEAQRPRCDVFWNNEILNTLRLKSEGLLQPCRPAQATNYPAQYKDPDGYWYGFAARARVIIVNTELVKPDQTPESVRDLADPHWRGQVGIAKPLFGTTASHVACLFALLGADGAKELLDSFKRNDIRVVAGNKTCAEMVGNGQLALGLTDTDDAIIEQESGKPVRIVFPDGGPDDMGTPLLPNTLAVIKGAPHAGAAEKLIDYLLSPEVEAQLARGRSAQIPLNPKTTVQSRVGRLEDIKPMAVDFAKAAEAFPAAAKYMESTFLE
jgi:iron(III) transport system substrate-binding protein